jgi:hypothetical protein
LIALPDCNGVTEKMYNDTSATKGDGYPTEIKMEIDLKICQNIYNNECITKLDNPIIFFAYFGDQNSKIYYFNSLLG